MDLKCKKLDCLFNDKFSCKAKGIDVGHNLNCNTYEKNDDLDEGQKQNVSKTMFEIAPQYHAFRHNKNVNIRCDARHCLFNLDGDCCSNGITIQRSKENAYCSTAIHETKGE